MEKCQDRIQLWLPETTYRDTLSEAANRDQAASAFIRHVLEQYLYGCRHKPDAHRCDEERKP